MWYRYNNGKNSIDLYKVEAFSIARNSFGGLCSIYAKTTQNVYCLLDELDEETAKLELEKLTQFLDSYPPIVIG